MNDLRRWTTAPALLLLALSAPAAGGAAEPWKSLSSPGGVFVIEFSVG